MRVKKLLTSLIFFFLLQVLFAQEWFVCLASFSVKENAQKYVELLEKNGLPSWIYFSSTPKGDYYRVLYESSSQTREEAHLVRDRVAASKGAAALNLKGLWVCTAEKVGEVLPEPEPAEPLEEEPIKEEPIEEEPIEEEPIQEEAVQEEEVPEPETPPLLAYEIPDTFSSDIQKIIADFTINQNFQLQKFELYDIKNIINNYGSTQDFETVENALAYMGMNTDITALSCAQYKDQLSGRQFFYSIACGPQDCFARFLQEFSNASGAVYLSLKVKNELYDCWYIIDENANIQLAGFSTERDCLVMLESSDFTANDFQTFVADFNNDSSILLYPQIRKNLLALPKKNEQKPRDFIFFELEELDQSYAQKKGYVEWSLPIVDHWHALTLFIQNNKKISAEFFDLDFDYNASQIHQIFMSMHDQGGVSTINHPIVINDSDGWYVNHLDYNEVSFSNDVYIITLDSYQGEFFSEEDLISFAKELQVWDIQAKEEAFAK